MKYVAVIEGQSLPLPEEIARDDAKVKAALAPYFSWASTAQIMRSTGEDGTVTLTVIKKSGQKGNTRLVISDLQIAPASENSAVALWRRLKDTPGFTNQPPTEETLKLERKIKRALEAGNQETNNIGLALTRLMDASAEPSVVVPEGF